MSLQVVQRFLREGGPVGCCGATTRVVLTLLSVFLRFFGCFFGLWGEPAPTGCRIRQSGGPVPLRDDGVSAGVRLRNLRVKRWMCS